MEGILVFSIWRNIFLFEKDAETWWRRANAWVSFMPFGWCMRHHTMTKPALPLCS
jgi:hypothetical protein